MNGFVDAENRKRTAAYRKSAHAEEMFRAMNRALAPLESYEPSPRERPTLFIFGLPRSGTTLAYQLLAQCLDIGYVNNLIARFWQAPLHGIALSQVVLGRPSAAAFDSDFGKTRGPHGPHEFAYFWQSWLGMNSVEDLLRFNAPSSQVDWPALGGVVRCMQDAFDSGIVFKTMYVANHIREFAAAFAQPLFVYVDRDPVDVGLSILAGRKAYYGDPQVWWATYPPDFQSLAELPFAEQIAGQVQSLRATYENALGLLDPSLVLRVGYEALCAEPGKVLDGVRSRLRERYGYDQRISALMPGAFAVQRHLAAGDADQQAVVHALARRGFVR